MFEPPVLRGLHQRIDDAFMNRLVALLNGVAGCAGDIGADADIDTSTTLLYGAAMSGLPIDLKPHRRPRPGPVTGSAGQTDGLGVPGDARQHPLHDRKGPMFPQRSRNGVPEP